jgi:hypothetical protein
MSFHVFMDRTHFGQNFFAIKVLPDAINPIAQTKRLSEPIALMPMVTGEIAVHAQLNQHAQR